MDLHRYVLIRAPLLCLADLTALFVLFAKGEVNAKRIREEYFKGVLRQDIAFFDTLGAGEVTTRIQTDTRMYQPAISSYLSDLAL